MRDLYAEYIAEREGFQTQTHYGEDGEPIAFLTYKIFSEQKECYIRDGYVCPEYRDQMATLSKKMVEDVTEIAKEAGCKTVIGSVSPPAEGATQSLRGMMRWGFRLSAKHNNGIVYVVKEIK